MNDFVDGVWWIAVVDRYYPVKWSDNSWDLNTMTEPTISRELIERSYSRALAGTKW